MPMDSRIGKATTLGRSIQKCELAACSASHGSYRCEELHEVTGCSSRIPVPSSRFGELEHGHQIVLFLVHLAIDGTQRVGDIAAGYVRR